MPFCSLNLGKKLENLTKLPSSPLHTSLTNKFEHIQSEPQMEFCRMLNTLAPKLVKLCKMSKSGSAACVLLRENGVKRLFVLLKMNYVSVIEKCLWIVLYEKKALQSCPVFVELLLKVKLHVEFEKSTSS